MQLVYMRAVPITFLKLEQIHHYTHTNLKKNEKHFEKLKKNNNTNTTLLVVLFFYFHHSKVNFNCFIASVTSLLASRVCSWATLLK